MSITVLKNKAARGPFTRAQIADALVRGEFTLQYLAHAPGLKDWLPLGEVLDYVERGQARPAIPEPSSISPTAAAVNLPPIPHPDGLPPVPAARDLAVPLPPAPAVIVPPRPPEIPPVVAGQPDLPPITTLPPLTSPPAMSPVSPAVPPAEIPGAIAPFFPRLLAFVIDCGVLFGPILFLYGVAAVTLALQNAWEDVDPESRRQNWSLLHRNFFELVGLMAVGFAWLYAAGLEASRWQATVGKQWMRLKVTDLAGERLGFLQATKRHLAKYLSAVPLFLGFMVALFDSQGRAWHDRLAGTRVVKR